MQNILLFLLASIAAPAWAEEAAAPATAAQTTVTVELSGSAKGVRALLSELEKDAVYKDAGCSGKPMKKSAKTAKISCTNASGALLDYLGKNAPAKVHWSISATSNQTASQSVAPLITCPPGCVFMNCPTTPKCCNTTTRLPC